MSVSLEVFWETTGTTGLVGNLSRLAGTTPDVDFTAVDTARFRVRYPDRSVAYWAADVLTDPAATATTVSVRHVLEAGDLVVGTLRAWIEVSTDGGAHWYTSRTSEQLVVTDP